VAVHAEGDALVLTGSVSSSAVAARAVALADHYAPGKVVNLMSVRGPEQVMLTVHVAEVQRQALRQLGIANLVEGLSNNGPVTIPPITNDPNAVSNLFGAVSGPLFTHGTYNIEGLFTALEQKGFASTLAKPTLIALSGETAVFFAGGEFPVPVPQVSSVGAAQITVQFKQYGVSVGFTPTVYGDTINLAIAPEVSSLDKANSVNLQGYSIPGITTRRARTTVELRDGQSFAIAGLIRREFSDTLRGVPFAASLPIFGQLFRSTAYQNNETEVVIIVTVHLAKPTTRENLLLPTETAGGPNVPDLFLMPHTDRPKPVPKPAPAAPEVR
jgi:pilus assembly protein CpaC